MKKVFLLTVVGINLTFATGDMESWGNGIINSTGENPAYFSTQTRGYYTLGSQSLRINGQGTFALAHIELPRLSVGCSGVDALWGGFSFLSDPKYLVAKLKAIGLAAASYAFKQGISSLCKDCNEIMDSLESVSDAINNFNLDTCAIGKSIGEESANFLTDAKQANVEQGISKSLLEENDKSNDNVYADYINNVAATISSYGGTAADAKKLVDDKAAMGSFLAQAIMKGDKTGEYAKNLLGIDGETGEGRFLGVIRYLIGDAIGYKDSSTKDMKYEQIEPGKDIDKVLEQFIYGDKIPYKTLKMDDDYQYLVRSKSKEFNFAGGLFALYKAKLMAIVEKMQAYQTISAEDRQFIQMQPLPVYKMLNVVAVQNDQALLDQVAEQLALRQAMAMLNHLLWVGGTELSAELQSTTPDLSQTSIDNRRFVLENIQKVKVLMQAVMANKMQSFKQNVLFMDRIRDYERQIKAQSQSDLFNMLGTLK